MTPSYLALILLTVLLSALAQVLLKIGASSVNADGLTGLNLHSLNVFLKLLLDWHIALGFAIYVLSAAMWIWVLTKVDISLAYPFVSLSFLITLGFGVLLFNEPLTLMKSLGTALIIAGCLMITRS